MTNRREPTDAEAIESVMGTIAALGKAEEARRRERHRWMAEHAEHPVLKALVEAHGPDDDGAGGLVCWGCEPVHYDKLMRPLLNPEPVPWPCSVWEFVNDRMPNPLNLA
jgi:hypothetical protein